MWFPDKHNKSSLRRSSLFGGIFAAFMWTVFASDVSAVEAADAHPASVAVVQVADSAFPSTSTGRGLVAKSSGVLVESGTTSSNNSKNATVPGSVIALVVALIAVVAVARHDTSGTT